MTDSSSPPTLADSRAGPTRTDWTAVVAVLAAGVIISMQIGKLPPLLNTLRTEFGLDLVSGGLLASSVSLLGGVIGIAAGFISDRIGGRRSLVFGLIIGATGSMAGAFCHSVVPLLAARLLEGLGFVLTVVAGPGLIAMAARTDQRHLALGFWSSYMPLGVTFGMLGALLVGIVFDWRGLWLAMAVFLLIAAILLHRMTGGIPQPRARRFNAAVLRRPGPWLLAGCFACYTTQWFSIVTWMPTYLHQSGSLDDTGIALGTAAVVLINAVGTTAAAGLMHRGLPRWLLIAAAGLVMAVFGLLSFAPDMPVAGKIACAMAASGFGGMLPSAVLASVPVEAREPSEIATVNGVVIQLLNIGSFAGPPALAALVTWFGGWENGRWLLLAAGLASMALALGLRAVERQRSRTA
jgi:CP family cyanate transporter-like MFS transporter